MQPPVGLPCLALPCRSGVAIGRCRRDPAAAGQPWPAGWEPVVGWGAPVRSALRALLPLHSSNPLPRFPRGASRQVGNVRWQGQAPQCDPAARHRV